MSGKFEAFLDMVCTTQIPIYMYKVNLYMKYQSAVEILSILNSRGYCLKMPLNTLFVIKKGASGTQGHQPAVWPLPYLTVFVSSIQRAR